jgi:hypothetical protein
MCRCGVGGLPSLRHRVRWRRLHAISNHDCNHAIMIKGWGGATASRASGDPSAHPYLLLRHTIETGGFDCGKREDPGELSAYGYAQLATARMMGSGPLIRPVSRIAPPKQIHPTPGLSSPAEDNRAVRDRSRGPPTGGNQRNPDRLECTDARRGARRHTAGSPGQPLRGSVHPDRLGVTGGARGATQPDPQDSHSMRAYQPLAERRCRAPPLRRRG